MRFTTEQQQVINIRGKNLLVSAAAGSGKTAVLVQRVIEMITDTQGPIGIDRLLVVTFTNAAAAEMRERIGDALEALLSDSPDSEHLQRQIAILPTANITTIHAFCLKLIKQHFHQLDLDPGFRIGDEAELALIRQEALEESLEKAYETGDEGFLALVESFAGKAFDQGIESIVSEAYKFSRSHPWPQEWLAKGIESFNTSSAEDFEKSVHGKILREGALENLDYAIHAFGEASSIAQLDEPLKGYVDSCSKYMEEAEGYRALLLEYGYSRLTASGFASYSFTRLKSAGKGADEVVKDSSKRWINIGKKAVEEAKGLCAFRLDGAYFERQEKMKKVLQALVGTVNSFSETYDRMKAEKLLIDFNDVEHYALELLYDSDTRKTTEIAAIYQNQFQEVLTDEYQDSNQVQEAILHAVSKAETGGSNRFMVGDVKQSIYKFRLAMPELFVEKYDSYTDQDGRNQKIDLGKNFRSREHLLDFINLVFRRTMSRNFGDVTYDSLAALHYGATYYSPAGEGFETEIMLADRDDFEDLEREELEAMLTAAKIKEIVEGSNPLLVYDKSTGGERPVAFGDIAILMRTVSGWGEVFADLLSASGIPVQAEKRSGYFAATEVQTLLNVLRIIDNPRQDIPLLGVLRSPIVGLSGDELVRIRLCFKEGDIYQAVKAFLDQPFDSGELGRKVEGFMNLLNHWRDLRNKTGVHELLQDILDRTGYYAYAALSDNGEQKAANIELLQAKAYQFEKSRLQGLFDFLRYIDQLESRSVDYGEASIAGADGNLVQIMSIHKSKGLEFPVVILAGLGKKINKQDLKNPVLFHQTLGMGVDYVDTVKRSRSPLPQKKAIKMQTERELLSEELRILYVALTRAREKLVMIGSEKKLEDKLDKWQMAAESGEVLHHKEASGVSSMLELIMLAAGGGGALGPLKICRVDPEAYAAADVVKKRAAFDFASIEKTDRYEVIDKQLSFKYPYSAPEDVSVTQSVSEIKRRQELYEHESGQRPHFAEAAGPLTSAQKGTAYHRVFCHLDLHLPAETSAVDGFLDGMAEREMLSDAERHAIKARHIKGFLDSELCARMRAAGDKVVREKPFVMGMAAGRLYGGDCSDRVMVQGVVDAFIIEDDGIILIDYKTDYVGTGGESKLADKYKLQMSLYKEALESAYGKEVKEIYLYAVGAGKAVKV